MQGSMRWKPLSAWKRDVLTKAREDSLTEGKKTMFGSHDSEGQATIPSAQGRDHGVRPADPEIAVMARHDIVRIPANHYHVDGYRYTNLADALAQVSRGARARGIGT